MQVSEDNQKTNNISLSISEDMLQASVTIPADSDSVESEVIFSLLQKNEITYGILTDEIKAELKNLPKGRDKTITAAKGSPPENPEPEKAVWKSIDIPEDIKKDSERIIAAAPAPEIYKEVVVKQEVEKEIVKKPKIPFGTPKREKIKTVERKKKQQKVYIDPAVEKTGFVQKDSVIASVFPSKPGVPGRSVKGEPIYPDPIADPHFYTGHGINKKRDELSAEITGFLRIGRNWADIIPFRRHSWKINTTRDNSTILFSFHPGHDKDSLPATKEILAEADALEYPREYLLPEKDIDSIIKRAFHEGKDLVNYPLSRDEDAAFNLSVTQEKDKVFLDIKKGRGKGKALELNGIGKAIKQLQLKNIDTEKIKKDLTDFYRGREMVLMQYLVAQSVSPGKGPDQEIEYSIRPLDEKNKTKLFEAVSQDPKRLSSFDNLDEFPIDMIKTAAFVDKEQRIAVLTPIISGEPGSDVFGSSLSGLPGESLDVKTYGGVKRIESIFVSEEAGICQIGENDGSVMLRVTPYQKADVKVTMDDNRMTGYISLKEGAGCGNFLDKPMIKNAIQEAGITYGIDENAVDEALETAKTGTPVENKVFAKGDPSELGSSSELNFLVHKASGSDVSIKENGKADYRNQDHITLVKKGAIIAELIHPSAEPKPGMDITGKKIEVKKSDSLTVQTGENIHAEEKEGKSIYYAQVAGEVSYEQGILDVNPIHVVQGDLDMKVGNIKFPGSVVVNGSVTSGFAVVSGGDVIVGETVDRALISSEGKVVINLGIKGGGKAVVRSKKTIEVGFAEQCALLAVGAINIKNNVIHCKVKCNGLLTVGGEKGGLIGGSVRARDGIQAVNIGSPRGIRTELSFGQDYLISDQIEQEEKKVEKVKEQTAKIDTDMRNCEKNNCVEDIEKLRKEKVKLLKTLEKRGLRLFTLREKFEQHFDAAIIVKGTLYPGTIIESHGRYYEVKEAKKNISITFDQEAGRIQINPLDKG